MESREYYQNRIKQANIKLAHLEKEISTPGICFDEDEISRIRKTENETIEWAAYELTNLHEIENDL